MKTIALILCSAVVFLAVTQASARHTMESIRPDKDGNIKGRQPVIAAVPIHGVATVTSPVTLTVDSSNVDGSLDKKPYRPNLNVRLFGVKPPVAGMLCRNPDGTDTPCVSVAVRALRDRIAGQQVRCEVRYDHDEDGYAWATCFASDGQNLNAWVIRHGYGMVEYLTRDQYLLHQKLARAEGVGLWLFIVQRQSTWGLNENEEEKERSEELESFSRHLERMTDEAMFNASEGKGLEKLEHETPQEEKSQDILKK